MAEIDISFKIAAHISGRELSALAGIQPDVWEPISDTLQTTERLADRAFRAEEGGERFVVYFEAYTTWREEYRWNILSKSALLSEREQAPTLNRRLRDLRSADYRCCWRDSDVRSGHWGFSALAGARRGTDRRQRHPIYGGAPRRHSRAPPHT